MRIHTMIPTLALVLASGLVSNPAEARPHVRVVVPAPRVHVVISPWAYGYRPVPRPGWVWVDGHYADGGVWVPGYWMPSRPRPGYAWVPGHWEGDRYVDGYWRELNRPGFTWMDGYYDRAGRWHEGYWAPVGPPPPPAPPEPPGNVYHDYP